MDEYLDELQEWVQNNSSRLIDAYAEFGEYLYEKAGLDYDQVLTAILSAHIRDLEDKLEGANG